MKTNEIITGTEACPIGCPEWCALAIDKIEGLEADLYDAVQTAYERGAREWTRLNYPEYYKAFENTRIVMKD